MLNTSPGSPHFPSPPMPALSEYSSLSDDCAALASVSSRFYCKDFLLGDFSKESQSCVT